MLTPVAVCAVFFAVELALPARWLPGRVVDPETGAPCNPRAWTYFAFIVTLFTCRRIEDEACCAQECGARKWAEFRARVKCRIVPGLW